MRPSLRTTILAAVLTIGGLAGLGTAPVKAQGFGIYIGGGYGRPYLGGYYRSAYPGGFYGGGYGAYPAYPGGYYGGGYQQYYGNGGHDLQPHWHNESTPYGSFSWYGNGPHDLMPHEHTHTPSPYGGYRGYTPNPFGGVTESVYPSTPYTNMPW